MPPKRGQKRKNARRSSGMDSTNDNEPLVPPDRSTWPGWVEMESEPAFFNVMLKEMGVQGAKVQEVYGLDEEMLAILPQPVHALIFLFRYKDTDVAQQDNGSQCPSHIWFANQIPDFACASVALLNIVNNIPGLTMGAELQAFRDFTQDMDPMSRGDAIDSFAFVKRIHNSFARENDLLNADMHLKQKAAKAKKKQALAKARETKEAKKAGTTPLKEKSSNAVPTRVSTRTPRSTDKAAAKPIHSTSRDSSPLSDPPDDDPDFATPSKARTTSQTANTSKRRSARAPQPRRNAFAASALATAEQEDEEGFHFIAYIPIAGHVWKLDGLNSFPQDMGTFSGAGSGGGGGGGDDWIDIARPALQTRMAMYEGAEIEFNLMALVHDALPQDRAELAGNMQEVQAVEHRLDSLAPNWRELELHDDITPAAYGISPTDLDATALSIEKEEAITHESDLPALLERHKQLLGRQAPLRGAVRDALESAREDDEKALHRRHGYDKFVRAWLGALAEREVLGRLLEGAT